LALMVGHLRRRAERHGIRFVPLGRELVLTTVGLSSVILVIALVVFVSFPRVTQGWAGRGETSVSTVAGFSDQVSIGDHGSTILANPEIVLRVEFPGGVPDGLGSFHWRGRSYDRFDGVRWTRSNSLPPSAAPTAWYREQWGGPDIEQRIFGTALQTRVLFALHPAVDVDADNGIQPLFDNAGDFMYWGSGSPAYTATSPSRQPPAESLRAARRGYRPWVAHYLQLPRRLDPRIQDLADSLTTGLDNRYDRAVAIRDWLQTFDYTRQLPATARQATLEHFLFERQAGHCEYFSTAMVVLLRAAGIEARNVNGFLGGRWSEFGNYLVVTQNEAHSWVEAWFPGHGWVTFDPTPAGSGGFVTDDSWFWPGRIFFDGIQHRWSKWVLDYSMDDQVGIFAQLLDLEVTSATIDAQAESRAGRAGPLSTAVTLLMIGLGIAVLVRLVRLRASALPPHTRAYRALRNAADRFGVAVHPGTTPRALATRIRADHPAAGAAASTVVDFYLRARFGGESLDDGALREMRSALGAARRGLKNGA
jgi:transglutaminase-like putative cysteine protease